MALEEAWPGPSLGLERPGPWKAACRNYDTWRPTDRSVAALPVDLAGTHDGATDHNPHEVLFLVLAYNEAVQAVAHLRPDAHLVLALMPGIEPYAVGRKLVSLLERATLPPVLH